MATSFPGLFPDMYTASTPTPPGIQWNLDLTKSPGTGQIRLLNRGFVISRFFFIYFTILGQRIPFVISRFSSNRGSFNRVSTR